MRKLSDEDKNNIRKRVEEINKKKCTQCKQYKELSAFGKDKSRTDGYAFRCRSCVSLRDKNRNKEAQRESRIRYYRDNREEQIRKSVQRNKKRYNTDILYKLEMACRKRLRRAVKVKNIGNIQELIGCSAEYLRNYLASKFSAEMSWNNYGSYWHIDHIRPCASFDLSQPDQIKQCFHYSNLQPLEALENLVKGSREYARL